MLKHCHTAIFRTVLAVAIACPALAFAQSPGEMNRAETARRPDLDYITPNACMAAIAYPRSILKSPQLEILPVDLLSAVGKKQSGIDPADIEQAIVVAEPPEGVLPSAPPPEWAVVLTMASPVAVEVLSKLTPNTTEDTLNGKSYRKAKRPTDASSFRPDERTLIVGSDSMLRKVVANHAAPAEGRLKKMLARGGTPDLLGMVLVEPLRPALAALPQPGGPVAQSDAEAAKLVDYIAFKANVCNSQDATLLYRANDAAAAEKLAGIIDGRITMAQQAADANPNFARLTASQNPIEQASAKFAKRMLGRMIEVIRPVRKGATLTTTITPAVLFPPPSAEALAELMAKKPDLDYFTPDAVAGAFVFPKSALKRSPLAEYLPFEILTAAGKLYLGFDPVEIDQAIFVAEMPSTGQASIALVLKMASPIAGKGVFPMFAGQPDTLNGKAYRKGQTICVYQPDARTLIVGTDAMLRKVVAAHAAPAEGKVKTMLSHCGTPDVVCLVLAEPLKPILAELIPPGPDTGNIGASIDYVALKANVYEPTDLTIMVRAKNEASAQHLEELYKGLMVVQQQKGAAGFEQLAKSDDPMLQGLAEYAKRLSSAKDAGAVLVRKGSNLSFSADRSLVAGLGIWLFLPAVQEIRDLERTAHSAGNAGARIQSMNNLKQIVLAMYGYNNAKGSFPARSTFDAQGKPLLSWRVHLLPYIGQDVLYHQFHLNEPWDSEHNRALIAKMPAIYRNPGGQPGKPGMTGYLAVCGKGLMFDGNEGRKPEDVLKAGAKKIMVVEADDDRAVEWTKPQDWEYDDAKPLAGLGHAQPGGFCVAFADGAVGYVPSQIDPKTFHAMLTIAGGEAAQK